jgi:UDP-N-acetylglucosamine--N-acetylmuramyl-(pentapeptide) pyrophosphoryl-undecaprenol N-acetylglucosamine transferase
MKTLQPEKIRILVTGGHMTPALAVIDDLHQRGFHNFVWVGHKYNQAGDKEPSAEYKSINQKGIPFIDLKAGKLSRNWGGGGWLTGIINLVKIPWGFLMSFVIILRHRPHLIISFGGYLALPIVIAGRLLGAKIVTHEQTVITGLTNKIIPRFAHKIFISWPSSAKYYPSDKTVLTGNPLRPEIFEARSNNIDVSEKLPVIYVTGGNQGSHILNRAVFTILPQLLERAVVIHQTGSSSVTGDAQTSQQIKSQLPVHLQSRYYPAAFIFSNEIGEVFAKASLVIARSGANTTYEILALQKPAIFIPIPWVTHNEQYLNASIATETGLASILEEKDLSPESLLQLVQRNLDMRLTSEAKQAAKNLIVMNAAERIGDEIMQLLRH